MDIIGRIEFYKIKFDQYPALSLIILSGKRIALLVKNVSNKIPLGKRVGYPGPRCFPQWWRKLIGGIGGTKYHFHAVDSCQICHLSNYAFNQSPRCYHKFLQSRTRVRFWPYLNPIGAARSVNWPPLPGDFLSLPSCPRVARHVGKETEKKTSGTQGKGGGTHRKCLSEIMFKTKLYRMGKLLLAIQHESSKNV